MAEPQPPEGLVDLMLAARDKHVFVNVTTCACGFQPPMSGDWERHRMEAALAAVVPRIRAQVAAGVTREQWATRNLRSGGSIVRWSEADARDDLVRSRRRDPYGLDPDPRDLAHRWWTEYADGSVAGTPWTVVDDEPSDRGQTPAALVALGQDSTTGTIPTEEPR